MCAMNVCISHSMCLSGPAPQEKVMTRCRTTLPSLYRSIIAFVRESSNRIFFSSFVEVSVPWWLSPVVGRGRRDEIGSAGMLTTTHEFQNESFNWAMHFCVASVFKDDSNRCTFIVDVENCQWPCGVARKSYIRDYATIGTLSAVPCCSSCVIHSTPDKHRDWSSQQMYNAQKRN